MQQLRELQAALALVRDEAQALVQSRQLLAQPLLEAQRQAPGRSIQAQPLLRVPPCLQRSVADQLVLVLIPGALKWVQLLGDVSRPDLEAAL